MSIRHAKPSDIEDISWIAVNATPLDPVCTYRFPYRDRFPEDFQKFTRTRMIDYLTTGLKGDSDFLVYENPDGSDTGHGIIAYAVWDLPPGHSEPRTLPEVAEETSQDRKEENEIIGSEGSSAVPVDDAIPPKKKVDHFERRDANPARMAAYRRDVAVATNKYFDIPYPKSYYYLGQLATHPDYHRRGAAKQLVRWGLAKAAERGWTPTLLSSPMGKLVYSGFGFEEVGSFRTQVEEEGEFLDTPVMVMANK